MGGFTTNVTQRLGQRNWPQPHYLWAEMISFPRGYGWRLATARMMREASSMSRALKAI